LLNVVVHSTDVQDRDGAPLVLDRHTRRLFPFIERIFADAGYQGPKAAAAIARTGTWKLEIVKRNELHRFASCPSAGSSSEPLHGSVTTDASPAISSATRDPPQPSSVSP
jgi:hypothetical protein